MNSILTSLIYVVTSCLMLYIAKFLFDKLASYKIEEQIKEKNYTPLIAFAGYMAGIAFILVGAFVGPSSKSFRFDFIMYILYSFLGIGLMNLSRIIANKAILYKFDSVKEVIQDKNIGVSAVHFGIYLATGMIISACVNGEYGGLLSSIVYYIAGMVFLFLFTKIYDFITPYSIHDELEKDNNAAGIALAGNIIAIGLILMKATLGDVSDWHRNIIMYFTDLAAIILLLPGVRYVLGNIIVKSININTEIKNNNIAAGILEFITITCFALIVFFMVDFGAFI